MSALTAGLARPTTWRVPLRQTSLFAGDAAKAAPGNRRAGPPARHGPLFLLGGFLLGGFLLGAVRELIFVFDLLLFGLLPFSL
jgi:hypothetical protein